ncbi:putative RNA exonuclease [Hibiscus syriacus]|uniref:RNA exonuclease n=1 Tax=Hibiscus syriacus TaxID=106335 RepID=A0A6A2WZP4_HIBSY|nr:putative RNA exonuclease [Hibiscus syriacus]
MCDDKPSMELVMSLHVLAALYCCLGQSNEVVPVLDRSIEIPVIEDGQTHALAKFAGCMQLDDTYAMLVQIENSILCYTAGRMVLQAPASFEEAADRRLMGLISDAKEDYGSALEHYVLASLAMAANGCELDLASIYCSIGDAYLSLAQALKLLKKALSIFSEAPRKQTTIACIEAQMGVMYYMMGSYADSYNTFKSAISKFRVSGEKKSALFGIALNQMGLACIQQYSINEAAGLFEEARSILEKEYGPYHPETLGVYSNMAGTYDAMAIEILDYVVDMREEKVDEKRRLSELLKEAGKVRSRKSRALVTLLDTSTQIIKDDGIKAFWLYEILLDVNFYHIKVRDPPVISTTATCIQSYASMVVLLRFSLNVNIVSHHLIAGSSLIWEIKLTKDKLNFKPSRWKWVALVNQGSMVKVKELTNQPQLNGIYEPSFTFPSL